VNAVARLASSPRRQLSAVPDAQQLGYACTGLGVWLPGPRGERPVLTGIDLEIAGGEIVMVVGRSGTGKTTLLRALGGLVPASAGTVLLGDEVVDGPPPSAVTVFQDYAHALLPWRTVKRNVALGLEGRRDCSRAEREERVARALEIVGLEGRADDRPWRLSGGMQQRVQIARALALAPRVLLMDEPFGALDAMTKASLQDQLLEVQARTAATIVFVTHDIDEAVYLGDRVVVLDGQPGTITRQVAVDLPRPRHQLTTKEHPEFLELRRRVYDAVGGIHDG
jgi:NitT/TauT family transport system ATP-binding protein